ncbi:MAG: sigma-70 family RNA polymerase sigma factor [Minicystis sp.]
MPGSERGAGAPAFMVSGALSLETAALRPAVRAVIACVLGEGKDHPDVEDCTHETLRRALEGQARLREGEALRPWVLGIARHVALDARRARKRDRLRMAQPVGEDGEEPVDLLVDPLAAPDERAATAQRARQVGEAMAGMSEAQRKAMILFHVEGQNYQRIAEQLGVPMGTVATWLARGRKLLSGALGGTVEQ